MAEVTGQQRADTKVDDDSNEIFQAALSIGSLTLLISQREIEGLEPMVDIQMNSTGQQVGTLMLNDVACPVYFPSSDLKLLDEFVASRRICVVLRCRDRVFGIACDAVEMHKFSEVREAVLPDVMRSSGRDGLDGIAIIDDRIVCRISPQTLENLLSQASAVPLHATAA